MSVIVENLQRFNRRERFYVVGWALGVPQLILNVSARMCLSEKLALDIPEHAFVTLDFALDWLYASLVLRSNPPLKVPYPSQCQLHATSEDVDLLVAYDDGPTCHIVLLEAKGRTSWINKQMRSKAERLRRLFEESR